MKKNWKNILLTFLVLMTLLSLALVWIYIDSLTFKILNTLLLVVTIIWNGVVHNRIKIK